jgi:hypothetical protein
MLPIGYNKLINYIMRWEEGDYQLAQRERWFLPVEFRNMFINVMQQEGFVNTIHEDFYRIVVPTLELDTENEGVHLVAKYFEYLSSVSAEEWESSNSDSRVARWVEFFELFARHHVGFAAHIRNMANPTSPGLAYPLLFLHTGVFADSFDLRLALHGFRVCSFKTYYKYDEPPSPGWLPVNVMALMDILQYPRSLDNLRESGLIKSEENLALLRSFEELYANDGIRVRAHLSWLSEFLCRRKPVEGERSGQSPSS